MRHIKTRGMSTTTPLPPPHGPTTTEPPADVPPTPARRPALAEVVADVVPVIGVVFVAGPPVIFIAGPWLLFALMLSGPVALLAAFAALWVVAALLLAILAGLIATPYLLVRGVVRRRRTSHAPALRVPSLESPQVMA